jgi:HEPN domain-containing protein
MLDRAYARDARQWESVARAVQRGDQRPGPRQHNLTELTDRVTAVRNRTAAAAAQLVNEEEQIARINDELASHDPGNPEYKRLADEAREAARRAREIARRYVSS